MLKQVAGRHCKKFRAAEDNKFNPNKFNINNKLRNIFPLQCYFSLHKNNRSTPRKTNRSMHKNNESTPKTKIQRDREQPEMERGRERFGTWDNQNGDFGRRSGDGAGRTGGNLVGGLDVPVEGSCSLVVDDGVEGKCFGEENGLKRRRWRWTCRWRWRARVVDFTVGLREEMEREGGKDLGEK
jgi:hypothetical protein